MNNELKDQVLLNAWRFYWDLSTWRFALKPAIFRVGAAGCPSFLIWKMRSRRSQRKYTQASGHVLHTARADSSIDNVQNGGEGIAREDSIEIEGNGW